MLGIACYSPDCSNPVIGQCRCGQFYCTQHRTNKFCGECASQKAEEAEAKAKELAIELEAAAKKQAEILASAAKRAEAQRHDDRYMSLALQIQQLPYPPTRMRILFLFMGLGFFLPILLCNDIANLGRGACAVIMIAIVVEGILIGISFAWKEQYTQDAHAYLVQQITAIDEKNIGFRDFYLALEKARTEEYYRKNPTERRKTR